MKPTPLTDQQKADLNDKRSTHVRPLKPDKDVYLPNQPVWFTDDNSDECTPGYIDSNDTSPDSYWIINEKSDRRLRRNKCDIKPRHTTIAQQRPLAQIPVRLRTHLPDQNPTPVDPSAVSTRASTDTLHHGTNITCQQPWKRNAQELKWWNSHSYTGGFNSAATKITVWTGNQATNIPRLCIQLRWTLRNWDFMCSLRRRWCPYVEV